MGKNKKKALLITTASCHERDGPLRGRSVVLHDQADITLLDASRGKRRCELVSLFVAANQQAARRLLRELWCFRGGGGTSIKIFLRGQIFEQRVVLVGWKILVSPLAFIGEAQIGEGGMW
jgi:hypothetical protein